MDDITGANMGNANEIFVMTDADTILIQNSIVISHRLIPIRNRIILNFFFVTINILELSISI